MPAAQSFIMTLANNDVSGQRSEGYMLIPLAARAKNPGFWGWPGKYSRSEANTERRVVILEGTSRVNQRIYFQDTKREFRLCTSLYFAGASENAILLIERDPRAGVDYRYSVLEPSDSRYAELKAKAKDWATSGNKRFGYF